MSACYRFLFEIVCNGITFFTVQPVFTDNVESTFHIKNKTKITQQSPGVKH